MARRQDRRTAWWRMARVLWWLAIDRSQRFDAMVEPAWAAPAPLDKIVERAPFTESGFGTSRNAEPFRGLELPGASAGGAWTAYPLLIPRRAWAIGKTGSHRTSDGWNPAIREEGAMKKLIGVAIVVAVLGLGTWALADPPGGYRGGWGHGMGPGMMGGYGYGMGPGMMGGWGAGPGAAGAPCWGYGATGATATPLTDAKAKEIATEYTAKYLPGFTVERILPFTGMHSNATMYRVELQGPKGEIRTLHINPWGQVMPFGAFGPRAATE